MFVNGLIIGLLVGTISGVVICSMLVVAKQTDEAMEKIYRQGQGRD